MTTALLRYPVALLLFAGGLIWTHALAGQSDPNLAMPCLIFASVCYVAGAVIAAPKSIR